MKPSSQNQPNQNNHIDMKYFIIRIEELNKATEYTIMKVQEESEESFLEQHESQIIVSGSSMLEVLLNLEEYKKRRGV